MIDAGKPELAKYLTALILATPDERDAVIEGVTIALLAAALGVCEVEVQRSIQGEDAEGPWTVYVTAVDWPLSQDGERYTRLRIRTPWTPAEQVDTEGAEQ